MTPTPTLTLTLTPTPTLTKGLWCCNRPPGGRGAGHIWYDFLHDIIPHRDRHNRQWDSKWVVKMGP